MKKITILFIIFAFSAHAFSRLYSVYYWQNS